MAITKVEKQITKLNIVTPLTMTTPTTAADGFALDFTGSDEKEIALFQNTGTGEGKVTLKHGDGIQGVADADEVSIPAGGIAIVRLDSGRFKNVSGENKDYVVAIPSAATIHAAVATLGTEEEIFTSDETGK